MIDNQFQHYNALDCCCTFQARNAFFDELKGGFDPAYHMTMDLLPVLSFMQTRGIRVDLSDLDVTKQRLNAHAAEKQEELNRLCGHDLNVNSSKQCQTYFYIEKGIPPFTKDGAITCDDKALARLAAGTKTRSPLKEAKLVQEIRGLQKLVSTYLDIRFDQDSRFRSSYNPRGTKFGRLSSSQTIFGTGGNAQNLPQEFKRFLVADPGYFFWEVDKRQAEWVVVAYLTGDPNMLTVVEGGEDSHIHTAHLMFRVDKAIIELENKLIGNLSDPDRIREIRMSEPALRDLAEAGILPRTMSARQCGKKSNHGLNYDEGPNTFALTNEINPLEAVRIIDLYHNSYPGIRQWYEWIKRQLKKDRSLTNCFGRKIRFMDQWGDTLFKAAYSCLPQSTVVDGLNKGMVSCYNDDWLVGDQGCNLDILAQVHDSILFQIPLAAAPHFAEIQRRVYEYVSLEMEYNHRRFKIATDCKVGLNWGGFHKTENPLGMRELKHPSELNGFLESTACQSVN